MLFQQVYTLIRNSVQTDYTPLSLFIESQVSSTQPKCFEENLKYRVYVYVAQKRTSLTDHRPEVEHSALKRLVQLLVYSSRPSFLAENFISSFSAPC